MPTKKHTKNVLNKLHQNRVVSWVLRHKLDTFIIALLLFISSVVSSVNMTSYPQRFEDEGTYVSQAWAIKERGTLTHYTYWYDHPPAGWIQMAGHLSLTDAIDRYGSAITAGREFMLLLHLLTIVLLYALARRFGIGSTAAGIGTLAFALSPLAVEFSRYALLDNIALPWFLGAFLLAVSPRKHVMTAIGSAVCLAIAILSKETFAALAPVILYALLQNSDKRNRRYVLAVFGVMVIVTGGLYILYAALKNELIPGQGHVSLLGTLNWQIFGREGSGSILQSGSGSRDLLNYWLDIDKWLLAAGTIALPFSLFIRKLRPAALAMLIGLLLMLRTGYLPYPHIITLLPFAALIIAGVLHYFVIKPLTTKRHLIIRLGAGALGVIMIAAASMIVVPDWSKGLKVLASTDHDFSSRQTVDWIEQNVGHENRLVVESALWTDIKIKGFNDPDPVWLYKTETDPAIVEEIGGWQGIDYVILNGPTIGSPDFGEAFPTTQQAIDNSDLVAEFGKDNQKILIYKVKN